MTRGTFWLRWWRKRRGLREKRFVEAHRDNYYAWTKRWQEWPEMATQGPWAGIAEDLTQQSTSALKPSETLKQALTSGCWAWPRRSHAECERPRCGRDGACKYAHTLADT